MDDGNRIKLLKNVFYMFYIMNIKEIWVLRVFYII